MSSAHKQLIMQNLNPQKVNLESNRTLSRLGESTLLQPPTPSLNGKSNLDVASLENVKEVYDEQSYLTNPKVKKYGRLP